MRYAVFNDPDSCVILWSTVEELVNMNMGRFMDGAQLLGLLRLCATPEDAKRAVAAMSPLAIRVVRRGHVSL